MKTYRKPQEEIRCSEVTNLWSSCLCRLELHIPWYPCSLKFCKSSNFVSDNYKCGIKTCRRGYRFSYFVKYKQLCLWDEWVFLKLKLTWYKTAVGTVLQTLWFCEYMKTRLCYVLLCLLICLLPTHNVTWMQHFSISQSISNSAMEIIFSLIVIHCFSFNVSLLVEFDIILSPDVLFPIIIIHWTPGYLNYIYWLKS